MSKAYKEERIKLAGDLRNHGYSVDTIAKELYMSLEELLEEAHQDPVLAQAISEKNSLIYHIISQMMNRIMNPEPIVTDILDKSGKLLRKSITYQPPKVAEYRAIVQVLLNLDQAHLQKSQFSAIITATNERTKLLKAQSETAPLEILDTPECDGKAWLATRTIGAVENALDNGIEVPENITKKLGEVLEKTKKQKD